jgi:hypothetical protein
MLPLSEPGNTDDGLCCRDTYMKQTVGVTNVENLILFPALLLFMFVMDKKKL